MAEGSDLSRGPDAPATVARVGGKAPDFEASAYLDGDFKTIKLSDFAGKWVVLYFYPGDFTFVCPTELAGVTGIGSELADLGVQVLLISIDSHFVHKAWQENELSKMIDGGVPFPMLFDAGGQIGRKYGVYDEEAGVDIRGQFLIDPDGKLVAMEVLLPDVGRNADELLRQVQAFQYARETHEVLPCGWHPGGQTLKPGPASVGKVWQEWRPKAS